MPTAAERQALAFLAGVALLGGGARVYFDHRNTNQSLLQNGVAVGAETVSGQLNAVDSARANRKSKSRAPKTPRSKSTKANANAKTESTADQRPPIIDVDVASAEEIEQLPRVGPSLAARIVANRDSFGAFGSLEALGEVRGIGPAMLQILSPQIMFSARPRNTTAERKTKKRR